MYLCTEVNIDNMGEFGLSLDSVLTGEEAANLFAPEEGNKEPPKEETTVGKSNTTESTKENNNTTEIVDVINPFGEQSESVGSEDIKGKENASSAQGASPNFYSSIAKAFVEDGIFPNLDESQLSKITDADSFKELIEDKIKSQLDDRQKRIDEALNYGVEPSQVQKYENNMKVLNSITEESINDESENGENLRKNIIYEDYIQKGFSKERAIKAVERSIAAGTDIEDAKESLQSCKEQITKAYQEAVNQAKEAKKQEEENYKKQAETLKSSIFSDKKAFGEIDLDKSTRQRVFDSIAKPIFTDQNTGERLTAIQKYERENHNEFMKYVGLTYVLTDGFKSLDGLISKQVKKGVNKGLRELEHTLNNTARNSDGTLQFASGVSSDPESFYKGFTLDI